MFLDTKKEDVDFMTTVLNVGFYVLIFALVITVIVLTYVHSDIEKDNNIVVEYKKDQLGNCYAIEPNAPRFSYIPCDKTGLK